MFYKKDEPGEDQIRALRRMTPAQRLESAMMLDHSARELKMAFLRQRHPDLPEMELKRMLNEAFANARD
jgi:hypothetical protein